MKKKNNELSRSEKLLLFLYEKGEGKSVKFRYEDIVVGIFEKHPHDFHLKGYPEYPDSGDLIHKPLYDAKKKGYLNAANKIFALTSSGLEFASQLGGIKDDGEDDSDRLSRTASTELNRIKNLEGFNLFIDGGSNKLTDNDLYDYLSVTVRTQKNSVLGRISTLEKVCEELVHQTDDQIASKVIEYHKHLMATNEEAIKYFSG